MIIESDAYWSVDPSSEIFGREGDVVTGNDRLPHEEPLISHGFSLFRARPRVIEFEVACVLKQEAIFGSTGDAGNEQLHIAEMLRREFHDLKVTYLPVDKFVNGKYFTSRYVILNEPLVRQNNWIVGNAAKVTRAKQMGFWFVSQDFETCTGTIPGW